MFQGHEITIKLNKAYEVLTKEDLRREYDSSIGLMRLGATSSWKGPLRPEAIFVDENACIGNLVKFSPCLRSFFS